MTDDELRAFYRRYNACCNAHRIDDLEEFVAPDVALNGTDGGLDVYADALAVVVRAFPDYRWEVRHLLVDAPWIAAHVTDTGTHRDTFLGVEATGRTVHVRSSPSTASTPAGSPRSGHGLPRGPAAAAPVTLPSAGRSRRSRADRITATSSVGAASSP